MALTHAQSHDVVVDQLDQHVRELVRREGVDPQRDAHVVRRIAESVVRDHDEHSLTGQVVPVTDPGAVVGELVARVSGYGPLQGFLDDPTVEEVWINDLSRVFIARNGRHEPTNLMLSQEQVDELVERMLKSSGRRIDLSQYFVCNTLRSTCEQSSMCGSPGSARSPRRSRTRSGSAGTCVNARAGTSQRS